MSAPAVVKYRIDDGCRCAVVCKVGRKFAQLCWIESGSVKASAVPLEQLESAAPMEDYPARRAARRMLLAGRQLGISKKAKRLLKAV